MVGNEFSLSDEILVVELLESIESGLWLNTGNSWTVFVEVLSEVLNVTNKEVDLSN